jgi:hypothetical protein
MRKLLFLAALSLSVITNGQPTATIGFAAPINPTAIDQTEVSIAINKTYPANIFVSTNVNTSTDVTQSYYCSIDGGLTWPYGADNMPNSYTSSGDPSTAFDASGYAYLTGMDAGGDPRDRYNVEVSGDRGHNWSTQYGGALTSTGDFDKEMATTVDEMQTSTYANYYYCVWTDYSTSGGQIGKQVKINRSTDQCLTFDHETALSSNWGSGSNVQTGPNGEVYVCWADFTNGSFPGQNIGFSVSTDGGVTYTSSRPFSYLGFTQGDASNPNYGNTRVVDFPSMAVDKSCGPNRGRIYIAYPEKESSSSSKSIIQVRYSDNGGTSWSSATTVSLSTGDENWFPWIAVDDLTGLVNVVYYNGTNQSGGLSTYTYVAYADGNVSSSSSLTWQNIQVSPNSHYTAPLISGGAYAGDYIGITSFGGSSYVGWMDNSTDFNGTTLNGYWHVWVARVDYSSTQLVSSQSNLQVCEQTISGNKNYHAADNIAVANCGNSVTVASTAVSEMVAGESITLYPGFSTQPGAVFTARIAPSSCTTPGAVSFKAPNANTWSGTNGVTKTDVAGMKIFAYPNPTTDYITIGALNNDYNNVSVSVTDIEGRSVAQYNSPYITSEQVRQVIDAASYAPGIYIATINADKRKYSIKFTKE